MKKLVLGILAHVDSGKTTLSEGMLYLSGCLRKLGRVDHQDTFLDTDSLERERGITIFSKQAVLPLPEVELTLLDTPGHVDFSAEMERTLQVLDYAVLVISGTDGVQGHTDTLWRLLRRYQIPTFLFVNKMDLAGTSRETLMAELKHRLDDNCVDFSGGDETAFAEQLALCDEALLEHYLETGQLPQAEIQTAIRQRKLFPCYFGSALKLEGVQELLEGLQAYTVSPQYPHQFGAKVFKIARDAQGNRLTYLKVTGGSLKVKTLLSNSSPEPENRHNGAEPWEEKVDQLRVYSGVKFTTIPEAPAGTVCAVTGLTKTYPGQGLGLEAASEAPVLEPVLTYRLELPPGTDIPVTMKKLAQLEEEDPQLHILWDENVGEIQIQLMGEVQLEILQRVIQDRFDLSVTFGTGSILYKETIAEPVEGVGHYEPLRHYSEVHLLLEPAERGSGLSFDTICSEDVLDRNWQRLILTHLEEKVHRGVLTGAPITDMKITLTAGKAHLKHTEGGDFRQSTYRAVRQGLRRGESVLLEPWYHFDLTLPADCVGRAMSDLQRMHGTFSQPERDGERATLTGFVPVATMQGYYAELNNYSRGRGQLSCTACGYRPCHNPEEVIAARGYDPDSDLSNTADSVFCSHGAGYVVPWYEVESHMHLPSLMKRPAAQEDDPSPASPAKRSAPVDYRVMDKELERIFEQTYGPIKRRDAMVSRQELRRREPPRHDLKVNTSTPKSSPPSEEYLLVDGYNIIFAWDNLKAIARTDLAAARQELMEMLCNYQGHRKCHVILVFDAYKVKGNPGTVEKYNNIHVVYTKEAELADTYIEKVTYEISKHHRVRVATSDGLEQLIILGHGSLRVSASAFYEEIVQSRQTVSQVISDYNLKQNLAAPTQNRIVKK